MIIRIAIVLSESFLSYGGMIFSMAAARTCVRWNILFSMAAARFIPTLGGT
jgi:hypothetical protein